jgi:cell division protein FtsB
LRTKKHENLTQANITKVIELLNPKDDSKPITKKEACSILNIAYNTTRLGNIIAEFEEMQEFRARRKAQNRGKAATPAEIKDVVKSYLEGDNVSEIAKSLYRSPAFVKSIIDKIGIPQKLAQTDYEGRRTAMLPEQCVAEEFEPKEKIWAIRQNYPAIVQKEIQPEGAEERGFKVYLCYTIEATQDDLANTFFPHLEFAGKYCVLAAYDMGSLRHLQEYM